MDKSILVWVVAAPLLNKQAPTIDRRHVKSSALDRSARATINNAADAPVGPRIAATTIWYREHISYWS
jgi:hypothetical protein